MHMRKTSRRPALVRGQDGERVVGAVTLAAAALSLLIATVVPAVIIGLTWRAQAQDSLITARLHAAFVNHALHTSAFDWRSDIKGLADDELVAPALPERREIVDLQGRVIRRSGPPLEWPLIVASARLVRGDEVLGKLVLQRSMRPWFPHAFGVIFICWLFGAAIFLTLRLLPVKALRRALNALECQQRRSRRSIEKYANVLFERAIDGIVVFDARGIVRSCNPRAAEMLGAEASVVTNTPIQKWVAIPAVQPNSDSHLGQFEALAQRSTSAGAAAFPCEITISELPERAGQAQFLGTMRDLSERKQAEQRQIRLANFDGLTGLPNRSLFRDRLDQAMLRANATHQQVALMFLDLDRFKHINDSLGHEAGDMLLRHVADTLRHCLRKDDQVTIARLGGDEFTVLIENIGTVEHAEQVAARIIATLQAPLTINGNEIVVTTSLGIAMYPAHECTLDEFLRRADMAMYRAKETGRNACHVYTDAMQANAARRLQLEAQLRHALDRGEFQLHYQPKAHLADGRITGVEALLRWRPCDGLVTIPPDQFITVLEDTGLIVEVGQWVIDEALGQIARWQSLGLPALRVAVNLSARQLRQPGLSRLIAQSLQRAKVDAGLLELELTESMLMAGEQVAVALREIADLGVHLAIDDFGTGYSSLAYLKRFPVNTLKIDRSFIREIPGNTDDMAIASAIIALAHSINLRVVAEGVETAAQENFLRQRGCDEIQGYLLSRPLPADALGSWWLAESDKRNRALDPPTLRRIVLEAVGQAT